MSTLPTLRRRHFLRLGAIVASTLALSSSRATEEALAISARGHDTFDQRFLATKAVMRQIWDYTTVAQLETGTTAMMNAMNAFQEVYRQTFYLIINLRGTAVIYALDDRMWIKYHLGRETSSPAVNRNLLYSRRTAGKGALVRDPSLQALQQRGAHIAACSDALQGQARELALTKEAQGQTAAHIYEELAAHLVPDAQLTPSGGALIAIAQQHGFTYAKQ